MSNHRVKQLIKDLENIPFFQKISPASCLGFRIIRPYCPCCGGSMGVRAAVRKYCNAHAKKPKYKDKHTIRLDKEERR